MISYQFKSFIESACGDAFSKDDLHVIAASWMEAVEFGVIDVNVYDADDATILAAAQEVLTYVEQLA